MTLSTTEHVGGTMQLSGNYVLVLLSFCMPDGASMGGMSFVA